jgi:hypothetical protein
MNQQHSNPAVRAEMAAWLRHQFPELHERFDRAFALLGAEYAGLEWVAMPGHDCDGATLGVRLPLTVAIVHIHHRKYDTDVELATALAEALAISMAETEKLLAASMGEPITTH